MLPGEIPRAAAVLESEWLGWKRTADIVVLDE
jgi:hypothetical protein